MNAGRVWQDVSIVVLLIITKSSVTSDCVNTDRKCQEAVRGADESHKQSWRKFICPAPVVPSPVTYFGNIGETGNSSMFNVF